MAALDGIRVLDLSRSIAGPYAGQMLGDLGADVIKVEHPLRALSERVALSPPGPPARQFSPFWLSNNRNKRSLTMDLKTPDGMAVLADLIEVSDVVIESFGHDAREHLGLNEGWAWSLNPRIIWASLSMYGRSGPEAAFDGLDYAALARGGLLSLTGEPEGPPMKPGNSAADYLAGLHLTVGVVAALHQRTVIGKGQLVDISLLEPVVACLDGFPLWHSVAGAMPPRSGNAHPAGMPGYGLFPCRDGQIVIAATADRAGTLIADVLGEPDLFPLPGRDDPGRPAHLATVTEKIVAWTRGRTVAEAHSALRAARIPSEPVRDMETIWSDEQLDARGMFLEYEYRGFGQIKTMGSPLHLSESPVEVRHTPPEPGEHNNEILTELCGYDEQRVIELIETGVLWGEG
ncbi:MAG: CoA transferase [Acidobacteria bacterium]|nr:CoA transferase [Acidobacteriota bacterium]